MAYTASNPDLPSGDRPPHHRSTGRLRPGRPGRGRVLARPALVAALAAVLVGAPAAVLALPMLAAPASAQLGRQPGNPAGEVPTVSLSKSYLPRNPDPGPGDTIVYTVTLANHTSLPATGYQVDGPLPPEIVDATWACAANGAGSRCGTSEGIGDLSDELDVGPGGSVVYQVAGTVGEDVRETFVQAVILTTSPGQACEPGPERLRAEQGYGNPSPRPTVSPDPLYPPPAPFPPLPYEPSPGLPMPTLPPDPTDPPEPPDPRQPPYGGAPPGNLEAMMCRVNNQITPRFLPESPPQPPPPAPVPPQTSSPPGGGGALPPAGQVPPRLPQTGTPVAAYGAGGLGAAVLGGYLLWLTRRRTKV